MDWDNKRDVTLYQCGYCAADAGVPFDFRQPEPWKRGWMLHSRKNVAEIVRPSLRASPKKSAA